MRISLELFLLDNFIMNLLGLRQESVKVGDMLPAIFLPILYFPLAHLLGIG